MILPIINIILILAFLAWTFRKEMKLMQFRNTVRPDQVVRVKTGGKMVLAVVETRPGSDVVYITPLLPDQKTSMVTIHKIYPVA